MRQSFSCKKTLSRVCYIIFWNRASDMMCFLIKRWPALKWNIMQTKSRDVYTHCGLIPCQHRSIFTLYATPQQAVAASQFWPASKTRRDAFRPRRVLLFLKNIFFSVFFFRWNAWDGWHQRARQLFLLAFIAYHTANRHVVGVCLESIASVFFSWKEPRVSGLKGQKPNVRLFFPLFLG